MADYLPGWPEEWKKQPGDPAGWDPDQWVYPQQLRGEEVATTGGLAQAVMDRGEDDDTPLPMDFPELPDTAAMRSKPNKPSDGGSTLAEVRRKRQLNRDQAIASLRQARMDILARKDDPSAKWWALAQGMLAPTKTGHFGESLGVTAGLLGQERKDSREAEIARMEMVRDIQEQERQVEEDLLRSEERLLTEEMRASSTGRAGLRHFSTYIEDPDNPDEEILVKAIVDPTEEGGMRMLTMPDGGYARVPDNLDPGLRYDMSRAGTLGEIDPKSIEKYLSEARIMKDRLATSYWGLDLLKELKGSGGTGGIAMWTQKIREVFNSSDADVGTRGLLMALMGDQLFAALDSFGTQINEKELQVAKTELAAGGTRATAVNERILQQLVQKLEDRLLGTMTVVQGGNPSDLQRSTLALPLVNYGLSEEMLGRGQSLGLKFRTHTPFGA